MRYQEIILDHVQAMGSYQELLDAIHMTIQQLQNIKHNTILYRQMHPNLHDLDAIYDLIKVKNKTETWSLTPSSVRTGSTKHWQQEILEKLGVLHPVFTRAEPVETEESASVSFGPQFIFIPIEPYQMFHNDHIWDLGTAWPTEMAYALGYSDPEQLYRTANSLPVATLVAKTYKKGWPASPSHQEVIVDCESYYLLDLEAILTDWGNKSHQSYYKRAKQGTRLLKQQFVKEFRTYQDVINHLEQVVVPKIKIKAQEPAPVTFAQVMANQIVHMSQGHILSAEQFAQIVWDAYMHTNDGGFSQRSPKHVIGIPNMSVTKNRVRAAIQLVDDKIKIQGGIKPSQVKIPGFQI